MDEATQTATKRTRRGPAHDVDLEALRGAELLTVDQMARLEPAFTSAGLRWMIFHARTNGLESSGALVRLGRRVLLHREKFREFLSAERRAAHPAHQA